MSNYETLFNKIPSKINISFDEANDMIICGFLNELGLLWANHFIDHSASKMTFCYTARHLLELTLKYGIAKQGIAVPEGNDGHNLVNLYNKIPATINAFWKDSVYPGSFCWREFIEDINNSGGIDLDKKGTLYKYPFAHYNDVLSTESRYSYDCNYDKYWFLIKSFIRTVYKYLANRDFNTILRKYCLSIIE